MAYVVEGIDREIFQMGFDAKSRGEEPAECPYTPGSDHYNNWMSGYDHFDPNCVGGDPSLNPESDS